jgi:hypothetical protein
MVKVLQIWWRTSGRPGGGRMIEVGLVAGYLVAWAWRKARRVGAGLDQDVDEVLDAGLGRLHEVVAAKLGSDPALVRLDEEAAVSGEVSDRTRRRVEDAVAQAAEEDPRFAASLQAVLAALIEAAPDNQATASGERSVIVAGNAKVTADGGSAAAPTMGDVSIGVPPDPTRPGRPKG